MLTDRTVTDLLDAFASPDPTPGGGSAAALAGAIGTSLLAMVAAMPKTKTGTPEAREALDAAHVRLMEARAHARRSSSIAIRRPTTSSSRPTANPKRPTRTRRRGRMRSSTRCASRPRSRSKRRRAVRTRLADAAILETHGNPNAASDVGTAIALLRAGIRGAQLNVEINIGTLTDAAMVEDIRRRLSVVTRSQT